MYIHIIYSYNYVFGTVLNNAPYLILSRLIDETYPIQTFRNQSNVTALDVIFGK